MLHFAYEQPFTARLAARRVPQGAHSDRGVGLRLPDIAVRGRAVVLTDDVAGTAEPLRPLRRNYAPAAPL